MPPVPPDTALLFVQLPLKAKAPLAMFVCA